MFYKFVTKTVENFYLNYKRNKLICNHKVCYEVLYCFVELFRLKIKCKITNCDSVF